MKKRILIGLLAGWVSAEAQTSADTTLGWQPGYLDIHHINTGRGNSTFSVFPDGTTFLLDAGDLNPGPFLKKNAPLRLGPARPNDGKSPGQWIAEYVRQAGPAGGPARLDYLVVSHFHSDHFGEVRERLGTAAFQRTGVTEVGDLLPVGTMLDRGYPRYDFPTDLRKYYEEEGSTFLNYLAFLNEKKKSGTKAESVLPGSNRQIHLLRDAKTYPSFEVRNVKANGTFWTGKGDGAEVRFNADSVLQGGRFNENPLSIALLIRYGAFDYFTGADNTGLHGYGLPAWFDTETPMAAAVGRVDAMTLNHHGNRDASNGTFLRTLQPNVVVQQAWCSDQPGQEVAFRLIENKGDVFALYLQPESRTYLGPWLNRAYRSLEGHVLIRVVPGGDRFYVAVLDDTAAILRVRKWYGPYRAE